ncbi:MAG: adenylosuccinate synthetase [Patescibacteria group bacterium]|nr:adenylosuccinate synthetase [Patescibacteria group bacterium]
MVTQPVTMVGGTQWGDEGKGKIIDELSPEVDIVVRSEGGANAGHTVKVGDRTFVGHLLPCGVVAGKTCVLGRGVRIDCAQFLAEIAALADIGLPEPKILVDAGAFLSLPWHGVIERWVETSKAAAGRAVGSTRRGIGPIAATNALRVNVQLGLIYHPDELLRQLQAFFGAFDPIFSCQLPRVATPEQVVEQLLAFREPMRPYLCDTRAFLHRAWQDGKRILFEGAHGLGLDPLWGTYGYNTAGLCTFAGLLQGCGLPIAAAANGRLIGVVKAYTTRVGEGPFPSELGDPEVVKQEPKVAADQLGSFLAELLARINAGAATDQEIGQYLRVAGGEYGATTGRPRRAGWLDLAWLRYAMAVLGPTELMLTKLDCLSGLDHLYVVDRYQLDGRDLPHGELPPLTCDYRRVQPSLLWLGGWRENITGMTRWQDLPDNARRYVEFIEGTLRRPIPWVGTGPDRGHLIRREIPHWLSR